MFSVVHCVLNLDRGIAVAISSACSATGEMLAVGISYDMIPLGEH